MYNILKLNSISSKTNDIFDKNYSLTNECANPDGILVRSANMADYKVADKLVAVARAGAGVNNIPFNDYVSKGVVVFNTPGANANAVKELVLTSLFLCCRDIIGGISWANSIKNNGDEVKNLVEKGKGQFGGIELSGKTLGIVGLGAIGNMVADSALSLGMKVVGYDAFLNPAVEKALKGRATIVKSVEDVYKAADFITIHVPFLPATKNMVNAESLKLMKDGISIINLARGELVDNNAVKAAIETGKIRKYVIDFPVAEVLDCKNIIAIPHLGASTEEAEDNCAVMAAEEIRDYIENGNIRNSVNYPALTAPRSGKTRICVLAANADAINKASELANANIKISASASASKPACAYLIIDTDNAKDIAAKLSALVGVYKVRII